MLHTTPPQVTAVDQREAARHEISRAWTLSRRLSAMGGLSQAWDACQPGAALATAPAAA